MLGVDKADQFIAYYRPNLRCRRTWLPLLFHGLDFIRLNSYVACRELGWQSDGRTGRSVHKVFVGGMVKALLARATTYEVRNTRRRLLMNTPSPTLPKRSRISTRNPTLPDHRLLGDYAEHIRVDAPNQGKCRMCTYYYYKAKKDHLVPLPTVRRPGKWCHACKDHLCKDHFHPYHTIRSP